MLTFEFTGVEGQMTASEVLTSGMVGKQAAVTFDDSWADLTKTMVFRAGEVCRVLEFSASPVSIPADVLARPFTKLYVGVYGSDAEGTLVIPTIMAEGPMIRYGADPTEDETAEQLPVWKNLQNQIGDLETLETEAKSDLVSAINEVHSRLAEPASGTGLSETAAALLIEILRHAVYESDQSASIDALETELAVSGGTSEPDEGGSDTGGTETPDPVTYSVTYHLTNVTSGNTAGSAAENSSYFAVLTAAEGFALESVSVTMGGVDVTGSVYSEGQISIASVTGDLVITAAAAEIQEEITYYSVTNSLTNVSSDNVAVSAAENSAYSATLTAAQGYTLDTVTVTMDGTDVTASVYAGGVITIAAVTGDLVITAAAVENEPVAVATETLTLVPASSYPDVTTFEYTEAESATNYVIAKQGTVQGGLLQVTFDESIYNNWNLNFYVFDSTGAPYCQTDKDYTTISCTEYGSQTRFIGDMEELMRNSYGAEFEWQGLSGVSGFGIVLGQFSLQIPAGCTFIACMRKGNVDTGTGTAGTRSAADFAQWAVDGGITFTVTQYE